MKRIPLTQGQFALVDDIDFEWLNQWRWYAWKRKGKDYYVLRNIPKSKKTSRTAQKMHRLIMGNPRGKVIDHINGNGLDNRRNNLRVCTNAENCRNARKQIANTSGYRGVTWVPILRKWKAQIVKDRKNYYLGVHKSKMKAAKIRDKAARKLHGPYAYLNFPNVKS